MGKFRLVPKLDLSAGIDTNPLYANSDADVDGIFVINPGVSINGKLRRFYLSSGYNFTRLQFIENSIQNNNKHDIDFRLGLKSYRWRAEVQDRFQITRDPADIEILERVDRRSNRASLLLSYFTPSKDLEFNLRYTNHIRLFDGALNRLDSFQDLVMFSSTVNVSSFFRFLPKTALNLILQYSTTDFPNADPGERSDANSFGGAIGLSGKVTPKLSTKLQVGYTTINFDVGPSTNTITAIANLFYNWRRLSARIGYERVAEEAAFTNFYEAHSFVLGATYESSSKRYKITNQNNIDFIRFDPAALVDGGERRDDTVFRSNLKFSLRIMRKMETYAQYQMALRSSNAANPITGASTSDFIQQVITIGISIYY